MNLRSIDKGLIPIWHKGSTQEDDYNFLERYINDLAILRDSDLEISDKALILLSLNKSGRTDLLQNIDLSLINRIDTFIDFIENAFGRSQMDLRAKLEEIKRGKSESVYSFLNRVLRLYFRCHQRPPMTINQLSLSPDSAHERQEILYYFLRGLENKRVADQIKLEMGNLTFVELPSLAKKLVEVLGDEQKEVNSITEDLKRLFDDNDQPDVNHAEQRAERCDEYEGGGQYYDKKRDEDQADSQFEDECDDYDFERDNICPDCWERQNRARCPDRKRGSYQLQCYNCGEYGHKRHQCDKY